MTISISNEAVKTWMANGKVYIDIDGQWDLKEVDIQTKKIKSSLANKKIF